jgi:hypothetical protein
MLTRKLVPMGARGEGSLRLVAVGQHLHEGDDGGDFFVREAQVAQLVVVDVDADFGSRPAGARNVARVIVVHDLGQGRETPLCM